MGALNGAAVAEGVPGKGRNDTGGITVGTTGVGNKFGTCVADGVPGVGIAAFGAVGLVGPPKGVPDAVGVDGPTGIGAELVAGEIERLGARVVGGVLEGATGPAGLEKGFGVGTLALGDVGAGAIVALGGSDSGHSFLDFLDFECL